jgi:hypothetical protein
VLQRCVGVSAVSWDLRTSTSTYGTDLAQCAPLHGALGTITHAACKCMLLPGNCLRTPGPQVHHLHGCQGEWSQTEESTMKSL